MHQQLTTKQVAKALGVSEASVKRWCDKGAIEAARTAGGHRRLRIDSVVRYVRDAGLHLPNPEALGLPSSGGRRERSVAAAREPLAIALRSGDLEGFRGLIVHLYLRGCSCLEILEDAVAPIVRDLGHRWEAGTVQVYEERRACEIVREAIHDLTQLLPRLGPSAPRAIGGTLHGDPYTLASSMVALVLREVGWDAMSYGVGLPPTTLCEALHKERPGLLWLSVSVIRDKRVFVVEYEQLWRSALEVGAALALGGRALDEDVRRQIEYSAYCDDLRRLAAFGRSLLPHR